MKIKRIAVLCGALCFWTVLFAQIDLSSTTSYSIYTPNAATGINSIYVVNGLSAQTALSFNSSTPQDVVWSMYETGVADMVEVKKETQVLSSSLTNLQSGRGYVLNANGKQTCIWLIDYSLFPINFHAVSFDDDHDDRCSTLKLLVDMDAPEMEYYTVNGTRQTITREYTIAYDQLVWNVDEKVYEKVSLSRTLSGTIGELYLDAPYCNTTYKIEGDQFALQFGAPVQIESDIYRAKAVTANPVVETEERDVPNETEEPVDLGGSGPVLIHFSSNANEEVATFYEWEFSDREDFSTLQLRFTEKDLDHTFETSGNTYVRLIVSNEYCADSVNVFNVSVNDSYIDAPNFFTPGTTPGVNDEFRVAYKSIVSFHAWIYDRWGVKLYEWSDPSRGWDGKYNGRLVKPGVYFYVIQAKGADGKKYKLKGDINILGTK